MENNINFNTNKTPAGFNTEKMVADTVASLVYNASDNVSTAISLLIQTYKLDNREAEAIQRHLELHKTMLQNDWQMINKTLRGLKAEE